jgi:hypothetical protein
VRFQTTRLAACAAVLLLSTTAQAGEKKLMHCFAWTSIPEATPAAWNAFFKASDALPQKIKGVTKVWYGKLTAPISQYALTTTPEEQKKLRDGESANVPVKRTPRDWGMCMEMSGADTLKAYDADPYHKIWTDAYEKVRVEGTTTFNILGQ